MSRSERLDPNRPSLGPLFAVALAAWGGTLLAEALSWCHYVSAGSALAVPEGAVPLLAGVALVAFLALFRRSGLARGRRLRALLPALMGLACAAICSSLFWAAWESDVGALERALGAGSVEAEFVGDPSERDYGTVSVAQTRLGARTLSFRILWPKGSEPLSAGHRARVSGSLSAPADSAGGRWNHQQGYLGMVGASSVEDAGLAGGLRGFVCGFRDASAERIERAAGQKSDAAGLLAGIVLGDRTLYAGTELEQDFRTTGLAHLMAVSGTHLAVVTALLSWVLARTRLGRGARGAAVICCLVLYVALTGFAPSAMRACAMCLCATLAGVLRRRAHVVSALSLCVLVFVCASPPLAFSLGFQLSVLAVLGLVLLSPLAALWLRNLLPGRLAGLADSVAATLSATLLTMPVTVPTFAQLPLVSPLATLLAAPLVTLALGLGIPAVLAAAVSPQLGAPLLGCALAVSQACAALVHALADLPLACVPTSSTGPLLGVLFALAAAVLWARWPLPGASGEGAGAWSQGPRGVLRVTRARLATAVVVVLPLAIALFDGLGGLATLQRALAPPVFSEAQVVMVDVGQGDCMLVRDRGAAVLVDTGEDGQVLERGLARLGVTHLDAVFITHKDADHCGALPALTGVVGVDHVFVHEELLSSPAMSQVLQDARWVTKGRGAEGVSVGERTQVGRFSLTMLAPEHGGESGNDDSLVNLLEYDEDGDGVAEARGLLTGDAEEEATAPIAASIGHVDFLKVAHHGSSGGATATELAELSPQVALIGVGADNRYGHPTAETLSLLEQAHARVYRTDLNGDITLSFSGRRMSVKLQKDQTD